MYFCRPYRATVSLVVSVQVSSLSSVIYRRLLFAIWADKTSTLPIITSHPFLLKNKVLLYFKQLLNIIVIYTTCTRTKCLPSSSVTGLYIILYPCRIPFRAKKGGGDQSTRMPVELRGVACTP